MSADQRKFYIAAVLVLLGSSFWLGRYTVPTSGSSLVITWLYQSRDANGMIFGVKPDGDVVFGAGYDREAEVKKFVELARQAMLKEPYPKCYDASFWQRDVIEVNPGPANLPPPITFQAL